jgi:hypothetical protein
MSGKFLSKVVFEFLAGFLYKVALDEIHAVFPQFGQVTGVINALGHALNV